METAPEVQKVLTHADRVNRRKTIADAVKAGRSPAEVAREHRVSLWMVKGACAEHDVPFPSAAASSAA